VAAASSCATPLPFFNYRVRSHIREPPPLFEELDAGHAKGAGVILQLFSFRMSRLAKSHAFPGPVFFDELDTVGFKRGSYFPYRFPSPTQLAVGRL
jgi:hypothetical protein